MAYKRIIGALTVKDGQLVKSYGYAAWRPAGSLITALKNLDRWAVDEIAVLDISRREALDPTVLKQIASAKVSTPIAYGGGIRSPADIHSLMELGCDRFVIESLIFRPGDTLNEIADITGRQALIASLPVMIGDQGISLWRPDATNGNRSRFEPVDSWREHLLSLPVSEFLITAVETEGHAGKFPQNLPHALRFLPDESVIWFGGLDTRTALACLKAPVTAAVAFGNPNHETELAMPSFRATALSGANPSPLRTIRIL